MTARYFSATPVLRGSVVLEGDEAHHLLHVMRAGPGDRVVLFDGSGWEFDAEVTSCERRSVEFTVLARREVSRELGHRLVMGVALPKGDRQKWLVEKLTELGVTELAPLQTQRGIVQPGSAAIERLHRAVIEASKQCGRNQLMTLSQSQSLEEFASAVDASDSLRVLAHPVGQAVGELADCDRRNVYCAVGPEGGFTEGELEIAVAAGWKALSLGPCTLRIETAAIALAALLGNR